MLGLASALTAAILLTAAVAAAKAPPLPQATGHRTVTVVARGIPTPTQFAAFAGKLFVFGYFHVGVNCVMPPSFNCDLSAGLYLDGQPIPGSGRNVTVPNNSIGLEIEWNLFGVASNVPAGIHHITISWNGQSPNPGQVSTIFGDNHTGAIALGG